MVQTRVIYLSLLSRTSFPDGRQSEATKEWLQRVLYTLT